MEESECHGNSLEWKGDGVKPRERGKCHGVRSRLSIHSSDGAGNGIAWKWIVTGFKIKQDQAEGTISINQ